MASGSSSSYRRRARSPTTGDMVERQRRRRFEQVLGGAALSLALPEPPAPISRLMDFSRRPWNVFGGIEAVRVDDAVVGPPAPPSAPPAPSTPLPRWMALATSPTFNGLAVVEATPTGPLACRFLPGANYAKRGTSARRHQRRTWIHYDRGKRAPSAANPRASLWHSANHAGSSSKT